MDTGTIVFLCTLMAAAISVAGFFIGRQSAAKKDGTEWGEMKTDIRYIKNDVKDIKTTLGDNVSDLRESISKEKEDRSESIRRLHEKIDEHIRIYHSEG